jgi:hypothetical protein
MSSELKLRRGSSAAHAVFIGANAEATVNTDEKRLVLHDGVKPGGFPVPRLEEIAVTPETFFAVGDGIADDSISLQQALNTGRHVRADRVYRTTVPITMSTSGQKLYGFGTVALDQVDPALAGSAPQAAVISAAGLSDIVVEGLTILANSSNRGVGVLFTSCTHAKAQNLKISRHGGAGVKLNSCIKSSVLSNTFAVAANNSVFGVPTSSDIMLENTNSNCLVGLNICHSGGGYGIQVRTNATGDHNDYHQISGNTIDGYNSYGIMLYRDGPYVAGDDQSVFGCMISNNVVRNISGARPLEPGSTSYPQGAGIYIQGAESTIVDGNQLEYTNTATNNDFLAPGAIGLVSVGSATVTNNKMSYGRYGLHINDSLRTGNYGGAFLVQGNSAKHMAVDGLQSIKRPFIKITNNLFAFNGRFGINIAAGSTPVAVPCVDVSQNTVIGNASTQILLTYVISPRCAGNIIDGRQESTAKAMANISGGGVVSYTVTDGGSFGTPGATAPQVVIVGAVGSGATATAVLAGGVVSSITPGAVGTGYTVAPEVLLVGGMGAGGLHGISCGTGCSDPMLDGNIVSYVQTRGLEISASTTGNLARVINNITRFCGTGIYADVASEMSGNRGANNTSDYGGIFSLVRVLADSATPSVKNGDLFTTNGVTSTTIADLIDGYLGQTVTLRAAAAITIQHGSSVIRLAGSVNFTMTSGSTLTLRKFSAATWDEVSRMIR